MVSKAKHMLFVNHNVERAFEETQLSGFDFQSTRNQFITTSKASLFQQNSPKIDKTMYGRKMSMNSSLGQDLPLPMENGKYKMDVVGMGLVTQ